jgi:hypothetical protein
MAGIEAETHPFGIRTGEEATDLHVGLGVRVEHEPHPGLLGQHAGEVAGAVGQRAPLARVEFGWLQLAAVGQAPVHRRQEHTYPAPSSPARARDVEHLSPDGRQVRASVQRAADGAAGQARAAGPELGAQGSGVGRQVAERAPVP